MGDVTTSCTFTRAAYSLGHGTYRLLYVTTAATVDDGDTITVASGFGTIKTIIGWNVTDAVQEQPTWVASTGVITVGGSVDNKVRVYEILLQ